MQYLQAVEIIPGRYYVAFLRHADTLKYSNIAASNLSYSIDNELVRQKSISSAQSWPYECLHTLVVSAVV